MEIFQSVYFSQEEKTILLRSLLPLSALRYKNSSLLTEGLGFRTRLEIEYNTFNQQELYTFQKLLSALIIGVSETENGFVIWGDLLKRAEKLIEETLSLFDNCSIKLKEYDS